MKAARSLAALTVAAGLVAVTPGSAYAASGTWVGAGGCSITVAAFEWYGSPRSYTDDGGLCGNTKLIMKWSNGGCQTMDWGWSASNHYEQTLSGDNRRAMAYFYDAAGSYLYTGWVVHAAGC